jgi:DNA mismatch repair protein MutL
VASTLRLAPWLHRRGGPAPGAPEGPPPDALQPQLAGEETASVLAWARAIHPPAESGASWPLPTAGSDGTAALPFSHAAAGEPHRPAGYFGSLRFVGQHARTYLLCEAPGGALVIIDQHASHERMLFHRLREAMRATPLPVQPFLVPQVVTLAPPVARALEGHAAELTRLGLEVEPFGGDAFAVKGAPAILGGVDLASLLTDLAQQLEQLERGSAVDEALHDLAATMACHAAVRANQDLSAEEARALLDGLDAIDFKARCPHGRPVVFELPLADLERRVGRR